MEGAAASRCPWTPGSQLSLLSPYCVLVLYCALYCVVYPDVSIALVKPIQGGEVGRKEILAIVLDCLARPHDSCLLPGRLLVVVLVCWAALDRRAVKCLTEGWLAGCWVAGCLPAQLSDWHPVLLL